VITISGGGTVQVFVMNSGVTFTIEDLTVANGFVSGFFVGSPAAPS